ncbi:hydrogenase nickel incorporation protein HypB [Hoeflea sp. TYP-13]|uniref:hydrogenase nickel incorporation protein HypB n=1 Tax=Hoeflea sp. TYP-13 TaxID=3230023 RepID=UPI0034C5CC03
MCNICGCGHDEVQIENASKMGGDKTGKTAIHHHHDHHHDHNGSLHDYASGPAGVAVPGMSQTRLIQLEQDIMAKNDRYAAANRQYFNDRGILALNLVSSPGSGKTTLLVETIRRLSGLVDCSVIEGDQQTSADAERIRSTGAPALQINTGKGCHLDGHMVGHALESLSPNERSAVFIENVGNLVCPAAFDLGEAFKVAILSVTEGEDKALKYPDMFAAAGLVLVNKIDLLPYLDFDIDLAIANTRKVSPAVKVLRVSAKTGEGMDGWIEWIRTAHAMALAGSETATMEL